MIQGMDEYNITTRKVPVGSLTVRAPFSTLFVEDRAVVARIAKSMRDNGFDKDYPIIIWQDGDGKGNHPLVEGHQRYAAAKLAGLDKVWVAYRRFKDEHDALMFAAAAQVNRRNLTKEAQCISILQMLRGVGEKITREELAEIYGISTATFGRASQVLNRGTELEIAGARSGEVSLMKTLAAIKKREAAEDQPFDDETEVEDHPRPKRRRDKDSASELEAALARRENGRDELPDELGDLFDQVAHFSESVFQFSLAIEDETKLRSELTNVIEELEQTVVAMGVAYPPARTMTVVFDDEQSLAAEGLKRCAQCHKVKPQDSFPMTKSGQPNARVRGKGRWCQTCVDAPDPTTNAAARRARREAATA